MTTGWMIGVMVEVAGEPAPLRHYFAVHHEDQGKAEWTAVDHAQRVGHVATSPVGGLEPVEALRVLPARTLAAMALRPGQVMGFGWKFPRRWMS